MSESVKTGPSGVVDVAIVGGGVSGVYTAYRLLGADLSRSPRLSAWRAARGGPLAVTVLEMSERIGGRLLTARPPEAPSIVCELGGMRYLSSQTLVKSLVEDELRLPTKLQVVDRDENLAYLRGRRLRHAELLDAKVLPYTLDWDERGKSLKDLMGTALARIVPGVKTTPPAQLRALLDAFRLDDKPLYQHGFWNVVARAMSHEAYALATATVGYDSLGANGNAVDQTFEYFDFTPDTEYKLLVDGYENVPWRLRDGFVKAGGRVEQPVTLRAFEPARLDDDTVGVRLHFRGDRPPLLARALVLAMPQRSLRLLDQTGPVFEDARTQQLIDSVFPVPLFKMFLAYDFAWWESLGVSQGRSLTDTMVRQCYYWGVEPTNGHGLIMAYDDMSNVLYWGGLRNLPRATLPSDHPRAMAMFAQRVSANVRAARGPENDNWSANNAPAMMVEEMHRQLVELHGVRYAPTPYAAAFRDWSEDPYGGGVHFWKIGYQSTDVMNRMTQPREDFPCYVCGEAYSQGQTWVEGALQTAEIVLQQRLGLPPPPWVKE
jgi:monoamine oxidase